MKSICSSELWAVLDSGFLPPERGVNSPPLLLTECSCYKHSLPSHLNAGETSEQASLSSVSDFPCNLCQHFRKKSFQSAPEPALERTASFCTPAFLPQPGAQFHPLPWELQPDAHSRLSTSGALGTARALSTSAPAFWCLHSLNEPRELLCSPRTLLSSQSHRETVLGGCRSQRGSGTCSMAELAEATWDPGHPWD